MMPVKAGVFTPARPMVVAEQHVRWARTNAHILRRRQEIETATMTLARQLGYLVGAGMPGVRVPRERLERRLAAELRGTFDEGAFAVRRELAALRRHAPVTATTQRDAQPDTARRRFDGLAEQAAASIEQAARKVADEGEVAASAAAGKQLHTEVLSAVGLALNLGRTHGALSAPDGAPTYSMRSEQLDRSTCPECERLHGSIVQVDSTEYYALLPPSSCYGGGRCRGVMVFADGASDLRQPET
jgi:hypothetical protein